MEVLLLGTGSSDGVPNAFCRCATCTDYRARGEVRTNTSVLVDSRLLIDPGPEAPRQATRYGRDLADLPVIIASHAHDDHLAPSLLMHRSWVTDAPLLVAGPEPVVTSCRPWLDPDQDTVTFSTLTAGDEVQLDRYRVLAIPANHRALGEALCYLIDDGTDALLYLTDTGPLPEAAWEALAGRQAGLVLLEDTFGVAEGKGDTHHNLRTFARTVARLRELGIAQARTRVVAIHLGHDNPPLAELRAALAAIDAEVLPDGSLITV